MICQSHCPSALVEGDKADGRVCCGEKLRFLDITLAYPFTASGFFDLTHPRSLSSLEVVSAPPCSACAYGCVNGRYKEP